MGSLRSFALKLGMTPQLTQVAERVPSTGEGGGALVYQVSGSWCPLSCPQTDLQLILHHSVQRHQVSEERAKE